MNYSPIRYPGGKSFMTPFFKQLIADHPSQHKSYAEPYAGGAGIALNLLMSDLVDSIYINDAAIGIYSLWYFLAYEGDKFIDKIWATPVTLEEWRIQRQIFKSAKTPSFELGFATFYLSRTNRSGILSAGPIGGQDEKNQASATYKIDCRFNKEDLVNRMMQITKQKDRIIISNLDALDFLKTIEKRKETLVYLDPPYYHQGKALYLNYYQHEDHVSLSSFLRKKAGFDWVLSYDNVVPILSLYSDFPLYQYDLSYTAQDVKIGSELITHSAGIQFPWQLKVKKKKGYIELMEIA